MSSLAGASASRFGTSLVPTHDQRIAFRGGTNIRSAGLALEFGQTGAVFPSAQSRQMTLVGDARRVTSSMTLSGSARLFDRRAGIGNNPLLPVPSTTTPPEWPSDGTSGSGGMGGPGPRDQVRYSVPTPRDGDQHVRLYTAGGSATIATHGVWTHTLLAGDRRLSARQRRRRDESLRRWRRSIAWRGRWERGPHDAAREQRGADRRHGRSSGDHAHAERGAVGAAPARRRASPWARRRPASATLRSSTASRARGTTTREWSCRRAPRGVTRCFSPADVRLERNDAFSGDDRYPVLPLLGVAFVRTIGPIEMKVRSSYGKGIRPPSTDGAWRMGRADVTDGRAVGSRPGGADRHRERHRAVRRPHVLSAGDTVRSARDGVDPECRRGRGHAVARRNARTPHSLPARERRRDHRTADGSCRPRSVEVRSVCKGTFTSVDSRVRAVADGYLGDLRAGDRMLACRRARRVSSRAG